MTDIIFLNVPLMSLSFPAAGTNLLKGIVENHGFKARVLDLNYKLFEHVGQEIYDEYANYFTLEGSIPSNLEPQYNHFLDQHVDWIVAQNPRYVGVSVFTFECQKATKDICQKLRDRAPEISIVLGGAGLSTTGIANKIPDFGNYMIEQKLADYYIQGEADQKIVDLLQGNINSTTVSFTQLDNIDNVALPNYVDVLNNQYMWPNNTPTLPITGSRGCVRQCTFCDIHKFWPKYKFRGGQQIALEMIELYQRTGIRNFIFTDSLINGSLKNFRELCTELVNFYRDNNFHDRYFTWSGQFICRDPLQFKEQDFEMASLAGMTGVAIGVESGSDSVLEHMKKGFTRSDLDFTMSCLQRYRINCYFLMIIGYPTETQQDFDATMEMFDQYKKYALDGTILGVNLGGTLSLDAGTDLTENAVALGLYDRSQQSQELFGLDWVSANNPTLTLEERIRRRIVLQERLMDHQLRRLMASYTKIVNGKY
jgi:hypothetical protein